MIAIAVLAAIVALLVAFIIWRFCSRRSKPTAPLPVSVVPPTTSEPASVASPSPWAYKAPTPMAQELSGNAAPPQSGHVAQPLSGNAAQGPIYEADPVHRVELDAR